MRNFRSHSRTRKKEDYEYMCGVFEKKILFITLNIFFSSNDRLVSNLLY